MLNPNQAFLLVQKLKSAPMGFTLRVKAELEKSFSICLKLLINAQSTLWALLIGPKAGKSVPSNLRGQFATLGANVSAFYLLIS
jgi:hypothetical protein